MPIFESHEGNQFIKKKLKVAISYSHRLISILCRSQLNKFIGANSLPWQSSLISIDHIANPIAQFPDFFLIVVFGRIDDRFDEITFCN